MIGLVPADLPPPGALAQAMARDLSPLVSGNVSTDAASRADAARDLWPRTMLWDRQGKLPAPPDVVVRPGTTSEVAAVIAWARPRGVAVTPYGLGSGVCGGAIPLKGGISLKLDRLDRIVAIDCDALTVRVEAGVNGWELEKALERSGLTGGHFPSSIACSSVGGWVAARSGGQLSSRYGKIEDILQAATIVLGTGETIHPRRPAAGPDLLDLFLGSEGSLGVITEATMRLWKRPDARSPRGYRFKSLGRALAAMRAIFRAGLRPAVLRLYDPFDTWVALRESESGEDVPPPRRDQLLRPSRRSAEVRRVALDMALSRPRALKKAADSAKGCLMVAVHEGEDGEVRDEEERCAAICQAHGARDLGDAPGRRWLHTRYAVSYKLPSMFEAGAWVDTCEVATGWAGVEALYEAVREAVAPHAFVMAHFSHAYTDGCSIYFTFSGAAIDPLQGEENYEAAWKAALDAADAQGATVTHHHGVGLLKAPWLLLEVGKGGIDLLRAAKAACDPDGILNPGKWPT